MINIAEVLKIADLLLFTHTGKHLDNLQKTILAQTLQGETYGKVASEIHLSEGHIRDTASELWQNLSDALGEDINKFNAPSILEKVVISNSVSNVFNNGSVIKRDFVAINKLNICSHKNKKSKSSTKLEETQPYINIDNIPEITSFYGREDELNTLKYWLIEKNYRIINLVGIAKIGKTNLAIKIIPEISDKFQYILYRSLRFCPNIDTFLTDLLEILISSPIIPNTIDRQVDLLIKFLRKHRCLIIIDDLQMLFQKGQFAGQYKPEFEGYYLLFEEIKKISHSSCFLLISNEKAEYLITDNNKFINCFQLTGLGDSAKEIFREQNLLEEEMWNTLIDKYQGHPLWLEMIAKMIQEFFNGNIKEFLSYPSLTLSNEIVSELNRIYLRLIDSEKQVLSYLAKQEKAITLMQLLQEMSDVYAPDLILNSIQSLKRRYLLADHLNGDRRALLEIDAILKAYIIYIKNSSYD